MVLKEGMILIGINGSYYRIGITNDNYTRYSFRNPWDTDWVDQGMTKTSSILECIEAKELVEDTPAARVLYCAK